MCMSLPTTHELNVVACVHACMSGPFGCTPQNPGDKRTLFVRIRHNNYTTPTCTTQCEQHNLALSLKFITKTFIEFPKFNWSYYLLRYMLQTLFVPFIDQKYTPTVIKQVLSRPTVGTKSNDGRPRPTCDRLHRELSAGVNSPKEGSLRSPPNHGNDDHKLF